MNILYLAHRIPYPPNKGDKIRSFNEIKYLAGRHSIDLICLADDPQDLQHAETLKKFCRKVFVYPISIYWSKIKGIAGFCLGKSISVGYFYRKPVQATVNQWLETDSYDAVMCFSSSMAEYIFQSRLLNMAGKGNVSKRPKLIMDFCDIDSDKWLQYSQSAGFPLQQMYQAENIRMQSYEKKVHRAFDSSFVVSDQEKALFLNICPEAEDLAVIPNGVDAAYFSPAFGSELPKQKERLVLVFTGAMDYHANVDGVCWFCREIFPEIKEMSPTLHFYIVGRNPAPAVKKLDTLPGVHVVGDVEDIRPWYQKADVYIVPLRLGRGVQNKVLEAMAMGRAVVATTKANGGIAAANAEHLMLADTAKDFAHTITMLLKDQVGRENLGKNARNFVLNKWDWNKNMEELESLLV